MISDVEGSQAVPRGRHPEDRSGQQGDDNRDPQPPWRDPWILRSAPWAAMAIGLLLRLRSFLSDRSMWLDEAFVAVNFQDRSLLDLLGHPLDYGHELPRGFLAMTWLSVQLFGYHDLAFRLFPFLCGAISLPLFYLVARAYVPRGAVPWAVILFSLSMPLIAYSGEFKQYSTDVAVCLGLLAITAKFQKNGAGWLTAYAAAGVAAAWFSLPAVAILATTGIFVLLTRRLDTRLGVVFLLWAANCLFIFIVVMGGGHREVPPGPWTVEFWRLEDAFMPSPVSRAGAAWILHSALHLFTQVAGLRLSWLPAGLFVLGFLASPDRKRTFIVLLSPILLCAAASWFEVYPFSGRVLLFLTPGIFLTLGNGIGSLPVGSKLPGLAVRVLLVAAMMGIPNVGQWEHREEIKECLSRIQENWKPGDRLYVYHWTEPAFRHYVGRYHIPGDGRLINPVPRYPFIREIDARRMALHLRPAPVEDVTVIWGVSEYLAHGRVDLDRLRGLGRVWILFTHCGKEGLEYDAWTRYLDGLGHQREAYRFAGAALYLYDL